MLIFLVVLLFICLYKVEYTCERRQYFNLTDTNALRGIFCVIVVLVHVPAVYQNTIQDMNISIHGGYSVFYPQKGFNLLPITVQDKYVFKGLLGETNTSLMLRPGGFRDWESTKFRDALNHTLVADCELTVLRSIPCQFLGMENIGECIICKRE